MARSRESTESPTKARFSEFGDQNDPLFHAEVRRINLTERGLALGWPFQMPHLRVFSHEAAGCFSCVCTLNHFSRAANHLAANAIAAGVPL